jgi:hypothetical protein
MVETIGAGLLRVVVEELLLVVVVATVLGDGVVVAVFES